MVYSSSPKGKRGSYLAKVLVGDEKWDVKAKKEKDVKAFFADKKKGTSRFGSRSAQRA